MSTQSRIGSILFSYHENIKQFFNENICIEQTYVLTQNIGQKFGHNSSCTNHVTKIFFKK